MFVVFASPKNSLGFRGFGFRLLCDQAQIRVVTTFGEEIAARPEEVKLNI